MLITFWHVYIYLCKIVNQFAVVFPLGKRRKVHFQKISSLLALEHKESFVVRALRTFREDMMTMLGVLEFFCLDGLGFLCCTSIHQMQTAALWQVLGRRNLKIIKPFFGQGGLKSASLL